MNLAYLWPFSRLKAMYRTVATPHMIHLKKTPSRACKKYELVLKSLTEPKTILYI